MSIDMFNMLKVSCSGW